MLGFAWTANWWVLSGGDPPLTWPLLAGVGVAWLCAAYRARVRAKPGYMLEFHVRAGIVVHATEPPRDRRERAALDRLMDRIYAIRDAQFVGMYEPRKPTHRKAQVVSVRRRRLDPAAVEVAAVFPLPVGGYRLRRVRGRGIDLEGGLAFLFDPHADLPVRAGRPSMQRWVRDEDFDTAEEAIRTAERQDVPADPGGWLTELKFRRKVQGDQFQASLRPTAQRVVGVLGRLTVGVASLTAFLAVWVAFALLDPGLFREEGDELVYSIVLVAIPALIGAGIVGAQVADVLARRNLAREVARRGTHNGVPGYEPRASGPSPSDQAASPVQDGPPGGGLQDVELVDDPQDVQDGFTPRDD